MYELSKLYQKQPRIAFVSSGDSISALKGCAALFYLQKKLLFTKNNPTADTLMYFKQM